jgi:hypothetical protein
MDAAAGRLANSTTIAITRHSASCTSWLMPDGMLLSAKAAPSGMTTNVSSSDRKPMPLAPAASSQPSAPANSTAK